MRKTSKLLLTLACCLAFAMPLGVFAQETEGADDYVITGEIGDTDPEEPVTPEEPEVPAGPTGVGYYEGSYYVLNAAGELEKANGLTLVNGHYYWFEDGKGKRPTANGLKGVAGHYYLFDANGKAMTGKQGIAGCYYYFNAAGQGVSPTSTGMIKIDGYYYCFYGTGRAWQNKLKAYGGHYYYFTATGKACTTNASVDGVRYLFGADGTGKAGWLTVGTNKYYCAATGKSVIGWYAVSGYYYYFDRTTRIMQKSKVVDGYKLDSNGRCKAKYYIKNTVNKYTTSSMTTNQKISALWKFMMLSSYTYVSDYRHVSSTWKWPSGWPTTYAESYYVKKGGNCFGYASVFGYLVKEATGLKVRVYHGSTPAARGGLTPHGWCTVQINGSWYAFDPDLYKYPPRTSTAYYKLYSTTSRTIHRNGVATNLY